MIIKTIVNKWNNNLYVLEVDRNWNKIQRHDAKSDTPYNQLLKWMWYRELARAITSSLSIRNIWSPRIDLYCETKNG